LIFARRRQEATRAQVGGTWLKALQMSKWKTDFGFRSKHRLLQQRTSSAWIGEAAKRCRASGKMSLQSLFDESQSGLFRHPCLRIDETDSAMFWTSRRGDFSFGHMFTIQMQSLQVFS